MGRSKPIHALDSPERPLVTSLSVKNCPFCGSSAKAVEYGVPRSGAQAFRAEIYCDQCKVAPSIYAEGDDGYGHAPEATDAALLRRSRNSGLISSRT